jgi:UDP-3-O-[3-hydroxymyristoyl] N-acetylglucosamine deacetylase/3-hydroxyacyl-[acyl-carrier-protein] dehydratase
MTQKTLAAPVELAGVGMVHGLDVTVRVLPAKPGAGHRFVRTDIAGAPEIPVSPETARPRPRRSAVEAGPASVEMTEHVLSALSGLAIDNAILEIDGPEVPMLDGSALPWVEAFDKVGYVDQKVPRRIYSVASTRQVADNDATAAFHPAERPAFTYCLDYGPNSPIPPHAFSIELSPEVYRREIAPARTFVLEDEIEALRRQGIGTRLTEKNVVVVGRNGQPMHGEWRLPDEPARHKLLDAIGDLALFGRPILGEFFARRSGHTLNQELVKALASGERKSVTPAARPVLDINDISRILPHRYPFLLVDKVIEMDPDQRAVGIKNVTINEPFFQGHWPGRPVMPGVMILEAMAQLGGLMLIGWHDKGTHAMICALDGVRLRRPVIPGDRLRLEAKTTRLRSKLAVLEVSASVDGEPTAEATMTFVRMDDEGV